MLHVTVLLRDSKIIKTSVLLQLRNLVWQIQMIEEGLTLKSTLESKQAKY